MQMAERKFPAPIAATVKPIGVNDERFEILILRPLWYT